MGSLHFAVMINTASLFVFVLFFILFKVYINRKKPKQWTKNTIPGPAAHPLFGNFVTMSKLDKVPYVAFDFLTQNFGPIVRLLLGPSTMVILGRYKEIKEAMNNELLDDRDSSPTADLIRFGKNVFEEISFFGRGIQPKNSKISSIEKWRELRRFTLKSLRDLGFGKSCSEEAIIDECKILVDNIKDNIQGIEDEINLDKNLNCAALNIIWNLVAGQRFLYNDQKMKERVKVVGEFMGLAKDVLGKPFGFIPFLRFFPPYRKKFIRLSEAFREFHQYIHEAIKEHRETIDEDNPRDLIDMFLIESQNDTSGIFTEKQLISICVDLFVAGSETTSKSLQYAIAVLIRYPEVQAKLHANLDSVKRDVITCKDKPDLAYVEAVLSEIWRFCNIAPFGPPRYAHQDVPVGDVVIPAGATIMYNTYTLHMDKDYWGDPEVFRPERFLDEQGKFKNNEMLNPFGIGRRKCLGESLARMENFLFFVNIFKNFKFSQVGDSPPSLEPDIGFTNGPYPFETKVTLR